MAFKNFLAAARKPNMKRFSMFTSDANLDWIEGTQYGMPEMFTHPSTLTGDMDGVNADFTMVDVTTTPSLTRVIWNGLVLEEDIGYTVNNGVITMQAGYIPESGDHLEAEVWV